MTVNICEGKLNSNSRQVQSSRLVLIGNLPGFQGCYYIEWILIYAKSIYSGKALKSIKSPRPLTVLEQPTKWILTQTLTVPPSNFTIPSLKITQLSCQMVLATLSVVHHSTPLESIIPSKPLIIMSLNTHSCMPSLFTPFGGIKSLCSSLH